MLEIETKVADVDVPALRRALKSGKARYLGRFVLKRYVLDLSSTPGTDEFLRVRTDGRKTFLTYKLRKGKGLRNTEEIETEVGDFAKAAKMLSRLGKRLHYAESVRESYIYDGTAVDINTWPGIPRYAEVEGKSAQQVLRCIRELGMKGRVVGNVSINRLYKMYGKRLHSMKAGSPSRPRRSVASPH